MIVWKPLPHDGLWPPGRTHPRSDPCGCSSSSADTAPPSSCLSCSGSRRAESPAAPPVPHGTPWRPAWRCVPCPPRTGTGAWCGTSSCTGCSGCTVRRLWHSPEVPPGRGTARSHTRTRLEEREGSGSEMMFIRRKAVHIFYSKYFIHLTNSHIVRTSSSHLSSPLSPLSSEDSEDAFILKKTFSFKFLVQCDIQLR